MTERVAWVRHTDAPSPTSMSVSVVSGPMTQSAPMVVAPSNWVFGWMTVSWPTVTSVSTQVVAGSRTMAPARISCSTVRRLSSAPNAPSWTLSLTPSVCQTSASTYAADARPRAWATATTSVRYFSPWALSVPRPARASRSRTASKA
jgi:hypothetical protein